MDTKFSQHFRNKRDANVGSEAIPVFGVACINHIPVEQTPAPEESFVDQTGGRLSKKVVTNTVRQNSVGKFFR
jgi:hypothetical protein